MLFNNIQKTYGQASFASLVPKYIAENLRQTFQLRPYQLEAFGRSIYYFESYPDRPCGKPIQLLYHMATGSGKTLIMAGLMLYLYNQGYRNFLFFVNSTNIIEKTKDNFLNDSSSKYLFAERIVSDSHPVAVQETPNFQESDSDSINICFSTVQGLHQSLTTPRENAITFSDFNDQKIVLIADEAHHINADTKQSKKASDDDDIQSWESTVTRIFNANAQNILLEFTATADLDNTSIRTKYQDKVIFDYPLRQFRADGYSKDVQTLQAGLPNFERAVQAMMLSQYRRKLFEAHGLLIKPVILLKSKTIKDSKDFQAEFSDRLRDISPDLLTSLRQKSAGTIMDRVFLYLDQNNITLDSFCDELKDDFGPSHQISVNSKEESEERQIAVNTLEDYNNKYRAVFAVDKLNEGWDVLNLFDIVRLYDTRDSLKGMPGRTTMQEAQLIGRGARYCPFPYSPDTDPHMRKFDDDTANELRVCEELYYHASYNPRYIQELNTALVEIGIKALKIERKPLTLKESFRKTAFYQSGYIFTNQKVRYNNEDIYSLKSSLIDQAFDIRLNAGLVSQRTAFSDAKQKHVKETEEMELPLISLGETVIREAISRINFFRFSNLLRYLPNLESYGEFITSESYLGRIKVNIHASADTLSNLTPDLKLYIAMSVLGNVADVIGSHKIDYKGAKDFHPSPIHKVFTDRMMNYTLDSSDREFGKSMCEHISGYYLDLGARDWYAFTDCYGTSEEKSMVKYIDSRYNELRSHYDEVYLMRNERHFQIYAFYDGRAFEPDFVLFLIKNVGGIQRQAQVFLEPKGKHLLEQDSWKQDFLLSLKEESSPRAAHCLITGLPFYCHSDERQMRQFDEAFNELLGEGLI